MSVVQIAYTGTIHQFVTTYLALHMYVHMGTPAIATRQSNRVTYSYIAVVCLLVEWGIAPHTLVPGQPLLLGLATTGAIGLALGARTHPRGTWRPGGASISIRPRGANAARGASGARRTTRTVGAVSSGSPTGTWRSLDADVASCAFHTHCTFGARTTRATGRARSSAVPFVPLGALGSCFAG